MDCSLLHCDTLGNASTDSSSGGRRRQLGEEGKKNERKVSERRMEERVLYSTVTLIMQGWIQSFKRGNAGCTTSHSRSA